MKCNALWDVCKIGSFEGEKEKKRKGPAAGALEEAAAGCAQVVPRRYPR